MADALTASLVPGGTLVTSGIIHERRQDVIDALEQRGHTLLSSPDEGEWCAVIVRKSA
jgi:ribosomal protein L11 methylase PrmA